MKGADVARYYFHLRSPYEVLHDQIGMMLPDVRIWRRKPNTSPIRSASYSALTIGSEVGHG